MRKVVLLLYGGIWFCNVWLCQAALAAEKNYKIAISIPSANSSWLASVIELAKDEMIAQKEQHPNIEFFFLVANTAAKQRNDLETLKKFKLDALVVLPISNSAVNETLNKLKNQGVVVIVFDDVSQHLPCHVAVEADNELIGAQSAVFLAHKLSGKGKIIIWEGLAGTNNTQRIDAFKKVISQYPNIDIVSTTPKKWGPDMSLKIFNKVLKDNPQIDAVWVAADDDILQKILNTYKLSGRRDLRVLMGVGGNNEIIKMIVNNEAPTQASIHYPPTMVNESIKIAVDWIVRKKEIPNKIKIKTEFIDQKNAKYYCASKR